MSRPGSTLCASLGNRNAQGQFTRAISRGNLQETCRTRIPRTAFCASLRSRNARGHFTRVILCRNLKEKMPDPDSGDGILCEPAQSKRTWTFYKSHVVWKFKGKMPDPHPTTSIEHPVLTLTVRTPQYGHTVSGN